ncbi:hypothetical protein [Konateibacter massiliensis]|uniref:hypothetical protein n=1 Tax=Konateibacter massiliensis TaxID=2002841 RepID=UPI000C154F7F|nr:hypothetical protein [Konateibacter massiliensis]
MDNTIETKALIKLIENSAIGRSTSYWKGFVKADDLIKIANMINKGEIDKFGNDIAEIDK